MDTAPVRKACCAALEIHPLDAERTEELTASFKALADPNRVTILRVLAAADEAVCVCDLEEHLGLSQPTVSHHLKVLADAGFLSREQRGRWAYYGLRPGRLAGVAASLRDWAD